MIGAVSIKTYVEIKPRIEKPKMFQSQNTFHNSSSPSQQRAMNFNTLPLFKF